MDGVSRARHVERAVALDDLTVPEAADFVADRLARLGVEAALTEAGAVAGDDVRIGGLVFDFRPLEDEGPGTDVNRGQSCARLS